MLHPGISYAIVAEHRKDMLAQASAIAQAHAAQRARRGSSGRPVSRLVSGGRLSLRPRMA